MKNLITMWRKASALLTLVGVLFASCNDISEENSSGAGGSQKARLSFSCNIDSRTIMPVNMAESDVTKIVLKAEKSGESASTQIGEWLSSDAKNAFYLMESDDSIEVDAGSYTFTLDLYTSKNSGYRLTQSGTLSKTVSAGTNFLSFSTSYVQSGDFSVVFTFAETARVGAIKAGLFTTENYGESPLVDGVNSFDFEELAFSEGGDGTISAVYSKNEVPNGTYYIKIEVYDSDKSTIINSLIDVIKVHGYKTEGNLRLSEINTLYSIKYNTDGGEWETEFVPVTSRNANTGLLLPTTVLSKSGLVFSGWYTDSALTERIDSIGTGSEYAKDFTLYAGWVDANLYVSGTGDDTEGNGSESNPYETVDKACEKIIELGTPLIDWTIYVMGDVTGPHSSSKKAGERGSGTAVERDYGRSVIPSDVTSKHAKSILLIGYHELDADGNPQDKINRGIIGNSTSTSTTGNVLAVATGVPVTIKNVLLTGGNTSSTNPNTDNDPFYTSGGGLYVASGATVTLDDGVIITNNKAIKGGGVYNAGTLYIVGTAAIGDKTVEEVANGYVNNGKCSNEYSTGGGVYNTGKLYLGTSERKLTGGIYYSYGLTASGGGIYNTNDGITVMSSGNIAYNDGAANGGGIYVNSGTFTMTGGSIAHNSTGGMAGGVYVNIDATFNFSGGTICANWATKGGGGVFVNASESKAGLMYMYGNAVVGDETQTSAPSNRVGANATDGNGAGICVNGGKLYMGYSSYTSETVNVPAELTGGIYYNYCNGSTSQGGGLFASGSQGQPASSSSANATVRIHSGTIANNYCEQGGAICTPSGAKPLVIGGKVKIPSGSNHGNDVLIYGNYNRLFIEDSLEEISSDDPIYIKLSASDGKYWSSSGLMLSQNASITSLSAVLDKFVVEPLENPSTGIITKWVINASDGLVYQNTSTLYVSASGSTDNDGLSASKPLPTLEAAVMKMTDASVDYTIILNGEILGCQQICNWEGTDANSITVKGKTGSTTDIINANLAYNEEGSALSIETYVPVTLSGITVKGGNGRIESPTAVSPCATEDAILVGGGLFLADGAKVSLESSTKIIGNHSYYVSDGGRLRPAPGCGAGAYVSQGASLYIDSGSVISDNIGTCYGAGVYVAQGGYLRTQEGSGSYIKANSFNEEFVDSRNEHVTPCGGGVYLEDGATFEMYGCYIRENSVNGGLGSGIYVGNAGSDTPAVLKMSGYGQINLPNDVYLQNDAPIYIAGKINADLPARLTPEFYEKTDGDGNSEDIYLVALSEEGEAANVTLSSYAKHFEVTPQNIGEQTQYWFIDTANLCKLSKQTGMAVKISIPTGVTNDIEVSVTAGGTAVENNTKITSKAALVFMANTGYSSYTWKLDGVEQTVTAENILSLDTSDWKAGIYDIYLEAKDAAGKYYSYTAQISLASN